MLRIWVLAAGLTIALGCSRGPQMHSVSGTVTMDGKPLDGASVVFNPVTEDGLLAAGKTNADGMYELRTQEQAGAVAGSYKVTVLLTKVTGTRKNPDSDDDLKMTYIVPSTFSDPETSGLEAKVPGPESYDFSLTTR
jgi:hypothetical protein